MRLLRLLFPAALLGCAVHAPARLAAPEPAPRFLYVWAGDIQEKSSDFLAVVDLRRDSPSFAQVIGAAPIGATGTMPHHTEDPLPLGEPFFANGFKAGRTYLFDTGNPAAPRLVGEADSVPGLRQPHSFARLANGHVVATFQYGDGASAGDPGGLAEFDARGRLVRTASSADPRFPGAAIRTYSLAIAPALDRALTTSQPMSHESTADVVQIWRLSDLRLLRTLALPAHAGVAWQRPYEPRLLADGRTVLVTTLRCALYRLRLDDPNATPALVYDIDPSDGSACGVPAVVGRWLIVPNTRGHVIEVLDLRDPRHPQEASRLPTGDDVWPHWTTVAQGGELIEITAIPVRGNSGRVLLAWLDRATGQLRWDERFRDPGAERPGISFGRDAWPDGHTGPANPHAALFVR